MNLKDHDPLPDAKRDSWLKANARSTAKIITDKFKLGRVQYGCDIGEQSSLYLLDQMEKEAIDQLIYVRELKRRLSKEDRQATILEVNRNHESQSQNDAP